MKKFNKSDKILVNIILRVLLSSVISIVIMSLILSFVIYKLDLSLDLASYLSILVTSISSFIVAFVSLSNIKNNGVSIGIISQIPIILFSFLNMLIQDNNPLIFLVKLIIMLIIGAVTGYIKSNKNKRFKVR